MSYRLITDNSLSGMAEKVNDFLNNHPYWAPVGTPFQWRWKSGNAEGILWTQAVYLSAAEAL